MGGRDAIRGYLVQALSTLLTGLTEQAWARVELEPDEDAEKVDVRWTTTTGSRIVEQIKSSRNTFALGDVVRWLEELVQQVNNADRYVLRLIGPCTAEVADLSSLSIGELPREAKKAEALRAKLGAVLLPQLDRIRVVPPQLNDLDALAEVAAGKLEAFLDGHGLEVPKRAWRVRIVEGLCQQLLSLSTAGSGMTADQLVSQLGSWVSGIREEQTLLVAPAQIVTPVVVFHAEPDGGRVVMELLIESSGAKTCYEVSGQWRWIGPYELFGRTGSFANHSNEFAIRGAIDPGVRKRACSTLCGRMAVQERLEVEVGARDVPRRLYYYEAPLIGVPHADFRWMKRLKPFELKSDVKPLLFGEYFHLFGSQTGFNATMDGSGVKSMTHRWDPPEKHPKW